MDEILPETERITFPVQMGGRRFPSEPNLPRWATPERVRELKMQPLEQGMPQRLAEAILQRLPWKKIKLIENPDRHTVVTAYIDSIKELDTYRDDVLRLIEEACRANLEFWQRAGETHAEARDAVLGRNLGEMMAAAAYYWLPAKSIAGAQLLSKPLEVYYHQIDTSLSNAVANFSHQLFELLAGLVDRELCGLVEWLPNHCCRYHFFRRSVFQDAPELSRHVESTSNPAVAVTADFSPNNRLGRVIGNRRTTTRHHVKHTIRFERHEHEVINAIRTSVRNSTVVMPLPIVNLVKSIPEWLYPFVEVIDGHIICERVVAPNQSVEDWTKVDVRDEPIIGYDPGIIIGPYVLSGWGSREIQREQDRVQAIAENSKQKFSKLVAPGLIAAAVFLSIASLWLLTRYLQGHGGLLFTVIATGTAIASAWQGLFDTAVSCRYAAVKLYAHWMTVSGTLALFAAGWIVTQMFYPLSWVTPIVLGTAALVSYQLGRQFR